MKGHWERGNTYDHLEGFLSPFLRRQRIKVAREHPNGQVLDYGCGIGQLADLVDVRNYTDADFDEQALTIARRKYPDAKFITVDQLVADPSVRFDTVVGLAILELVEDPAGFFC